MTIEDDRDRTDPATAAQVARRLEGLLGQRTDVPAARPELEFGEQMPSGPLRAGPSRVSGRRPATLGEASPNGGQGIAATGSPGPLEAASRSAAGVARRRPVTDRPAPTLVAVPALLIDSLRDRLALFTLRRVHLVVVAVLVACGLGLAGWSLMRARAVAVTPLAVVTTSTAPPTATAAAGPDGTTPTTSPPPGAASGRTGDGVEPAPSPTLESRLLVHVLGAVRDPGVVRLKPGARVLDAIKAAGGLTARSDPAELNFAQVLADGQQVLVGTSRHPAGEVRDATSPPGREGAGQRAGASSASGGSSGSPLDLNQATVADLDTLPGVGPVTAERIVAWRTEHGRFSRVQELQEVEGIGPKTYERLAPLLRV